MAIEPTVSNETYVFSGDRPGFMAEFKTVIQAHGWQLQDEDTVGFKQWWIPPVGETIGNAHGFCALKMNYNASDIFFEPVLWSNKTSNQSWRITLQHDTTFSRTYSLTVNGVTVSVTRNDGANQQLTTQALYDELIAQAAANPSTVGAFSYEVYYDDANDQIYDIGTFGGIIATANDTSDAHTMANVSRTPVFKTARGFAGGDTRKGLAIHTLNGHTMPTDYSLGFVYYLKTYGRSFSFNTKLASSFSDPIVSVWGDNAVVLEQTPDNCAPAELAVVQNDSVHFSHLNGVAWDRTPDIGNLASSNNQVAFHLVDLYQSYPQGGVAVQEIYNSNGGPRFNVSTFLYDQSVQTVTRITTQQVTNRSENPGNLGWAGSVAGFKLTGTFNFYGSATNEALNLVADTEEYVRLPAELLASETTSITVEALDGGTPDLSDYPTNGYLIINQLEVVRYTSRTTDTFSGLTRGILGTTAITHVKYAPATVGVWFEKAASKASLVGHLRPTD